MVLSSWASLAEAPMTLPNSSTGLSTPTCLGRAISIKACVLRKRSSGTGSGGEESVTSMSRKKAFSFSSSALPGAPPWMMGRQILCRVLTLRWKSTKGSQFDSQLLQKFRVFQAAKNDLAPFVRYRTVQPTPSRPPSSLSSSRPTTSSSFTSKSSQGISGGILTRNASAISLMSGFGSYTSLFPGQCTPVTLFVLTHLILLLTHPLIISVR
ncbi:hypothetical protein DVH24_005828 [Malus domestica]|uniref:Uncharacterized protein n=1 Tax=Malus domestica TaxID=3750 RepID=A0A498IN68_MALDO|nr:hypothetical protein DVH24_005828 [Malus domestica]